MPPDQLTADEQSAILAERYSLRAEAYDALWSPAIRPAGERLLARLPLAAARDVIDVGTGAGALLPLIQKAAPQSTVLGVDRSEGMLRIAREKHSGPLALMDAQRLELPAGKFDVAVVAFVLFHLPFPERCLAEVHRVLRPGGMVGTVTWATENPTPASSIWDEELKAAGAAVQELPAVDKRGCCDSAEKVAGLLAQAGLVSSETWIEAIEHRWRPEDHFQYQLRSGSRFLLQGLGDPDREGCLGRVRDRLAGLVDDQYVFRGDVVMATAVKKRDSAKS